MVKQEIFLNNKQKFEVPYHIDQNKIIKAAEKALDKLA